MTGDPSPVPFPRLQNHHQLMKPAGGSDCMGQRSGGRSLGAVPSCLLTPP